jgi:NhaP-type Na+/H+ or K+/H+ antiporter
MLKFEGVLIDPIGALLGVLAFQAVRNGAGGNQRFHPGELLLSIGTGLTVGAVGAALLWLLLRGLQRGAPGQGLPQP